jgi:cytochrome c556
MSLTRFAAILAAGAMAATLAAGVVAQDVAVDPAIATMTPEQLVEARQAAMKEDGGILRGAKDLTGADAVAATDTLIKNFTNFPAQFPEGSIVGDSKALPVIWEEFDAFSAIFAKALQGSKDMRAAAEAGDATAYVAALEVIGGTCGECHQKYRGK